MTVAEMIPQMTAAELENLYANAVRLNEGEGPKQVAAAALLPVLEAELSARTALVPPKVKKAPAKPRARKKVDAQAA